MELINNDEEDNANRNLINNNQNNDNNIQVRNNFNNNINEEENGNIFISKYSHFTFSFLLIMISNVIFFIYSKKNNIEEYKYIFEFVPIFDKNQYYRFITRYLIHFGFGHLFAELFISFYILYKFENIFGTFLTLFFIINSMLIISIFQLVFYSILHNMNYFIDSVIIHYEGGLAPILFSLNTFICSFENNYFNEEDFPHINQQGALYSSLIALAFLVVMTPNRTFIGNLCGIITGYIMKLFCFCFLPKISWIIDIEKIFDLKDGTFYRNITYENIFMKKVLNQIEKDSVIEIKKENNKDNKDRNNNEFNDINNDINLEGSHEQIEMSLMQNNDRNN